jgi:hypothetical protein
MLEWGILNLNGQWSESVKERSALLISPPYQIS